MKPRRVWCYGSLENIPRPRIIFIFEYAEEGGQLQAGVEISDRASDAIAHLSFDWRMTFEQARRLHLLLSKLGWPWRSR